MSNKDFRFDTVLTTSDPDDLAPGLPASEKEGLDGKIIRVRWVAYKFPGSKNNQYKLFSKWYIQFEGLDGIWKEHVQAGWLPQIKDGKLVSGMVPTNDGPDVKYITPAGASWQQYADLGNPEHPATLTFDTEEEEQEFEGLYVRGAGKLRSRTDHQQILESLKKSGFVNFKESIDCFEGLECHFNRLDQDYPYSATPTEEGKKQRTYTVLCVTDIYNLKKKTKKNKPEQEAEPEAQEEDDIPAAKKPSGSSTATTTVKKKKPSPADDSSNDADIIKMISKTVKKSGGAVDKQTLITEVIGEVDEALMGQTFARLQSDSFWSEQAVFAIKKGKVVFAEVDDDEVVTAKPKTGKVTAAQEQEEEEEEEEEEDEEEEDE